LDAGSFLEKDVVSTDVAPLECFGRPCCGRCLRSIWHSDESIASSSEFSESLSMATSIFCSVSRQSKDAVPSIHSGDLVGENIKVWHRMMVNNVHPRPYNHKSLPFPCSYLRCLWPPPVLVYRLYPQLTYEVEIHPLVYALQAAALSDPP
jgi:hypothetical protein